MKIDTLSSAILGLILISAVHADDGTYTWDHIAVEREGFCRSYGTTGLYRMYRVSLEECQAKCSMTSDVKYCTAIEYHEDTRRCEVHYWDITSVKSLEGKSRYGKVKCYEVCKGTGCEPDNDCYMKIGDGTCRGGGSGRESYQSDVNQCYKKCEYTNDCVAYEYNEAKKSCKTFRRLPTSADKERGKICFKWDCFDREQRFLRGDLTDADRQDTLGTDEESVSEGRTANTKLDSGAELMTEPKQQTTEA